MFLLENASWPALLVDAASTILRANQAAVKLFGSTLEGGSPLLSAVWAAENGITAEQFLAPSLSQLHSPYLMSGMKMAVDRIEAAIERKEPILVYGDYDVDGTTAIVILLSLELAATLLLFGAQVIAEYERLLAGKGGGKPKAMKTGE